MQICRASTVEDVKKKSACNEGDSGWFLGWEDPPEKGMQPTPVLLPGESHEQRGLVGYNSWGQTELSSWEHTHANEHWLNINQQLC